MRVLLEDKDVLVGMHDIESRWMHSNSFDPQKLQNWKRDCIEEIISLQRFAQVIKVVGWADEFCREHAADGYVGGNNRLRKECPRCWDELKKELGLGK